MRVLFFLFGLMLLIPAGLQESFQTEPTPPCDIPEAIKNLEYADHIFSAKVISHKLVEEGEGYNKIEIEFQTVTIFKGDPHWQKWSKVMNDVPDMWGRSVQMYPVDEEFLFKFHDHLTDIDLQPNEPHCVTLSDYQEHLQNKESNSFFDWLAKIFESLFGDKIKQDHLIGR